MKTPDAVHAAIEHLNQILLLDRSDELGARFLVPAALLRLGRDQVSYDFIKLHITECHRPERDRDDEEAGNFDVNGADPFEDVPETPGRRPYESHLVALTLIKIRLLQDLKALQGSTLIAEKVPREILNKIRGMLVGKIVAERKEIMDSDDQSKLIEKLEEQMGKLYDSVNTERSYFWETLLHPEIYLHQPSEMYRHRTWEHNMFILKCEYDSWAETPDAIDYLRELSKKKGLASSGGPVRGESS